MKKILRHGGSPGYHAKISCGLEIVSDDYAGLSVGLSSRKNHALSVVKGETKSRIESLPPIIRHERRCISEQTLALADLDHQNRKTSISKPTANAQRPNVQAETTRTRFRRSCGFSWDRSVIATAPHCSNCWGRPLWTGGIPDNLEFKSQFRPRLFDLQHRCCAVRGPVLHLRVPYFRPTFTAGELSGQLRTPYFGLCAALKTLSIAFVASKIAYCSVGDMPVLV